MVITLISDNAGSGWAYLSAGSVAAPVEVFPEFLTRVTLPLCPPAALDAPNGTMQIIKAIATLPPTVTAAFATAALPHPGDHHFRMVLLVADRRRNVGTAVGTFPDMAATEAWWQHAATRFQGTHLSVSVYPVINTEADGGDPGLSAHP